MRTMSVVRAAAAFAFVLTVGLVPACQGDPNDPLTWAKQVKNLRTQKEALDHLANMDVEKARPAVPALIELFKDTKRPEHPKRWPVTPIRAPRTSSSRRSSTPTTTSTARRSRPARWAR